MPTQGAWRAATDWSMTMTLQWHALRSKPNREDALCRGAEARGFQGRYRRTRVQPVNPRARTIKSCIPGYMFVQEDMRALGFSAFAWMPYSGGLEFCGSQPSPVTHALVNAIRRQPDGVKAAGGELPFRRRPGNVLTIQDGPFADYGAIFDSRLPGNKLWPLELPSGHIQRKNRG